MSFFKKDKDALLDYGFNWAPFLNGDLILDSSWEVPSGLDVIEEQFSTTVATIWLSGGTVGESYTIINSIITEGGRKDDRSLTILIVEK